MKISIYLFAVALITALSLSPVLADDLTWTWNAPTERTDGTPLQSGEIAGYNVTLNGALQTNPDGSAKLLSSGANAMTLVAVSGPQCATFATVDTDGRISTWPEQVCKTVMAPPGPPSNLSVTIVIVP